MGYYIETDGPKDKVNYLIETTGAKPCLPVWPPPSDKTLICVVDNGLFEAAAIAFSKDEMEAFNWDGDDRPKTWLLVDKKIVINLCPSVEKHLI
jgi:hypothetical protein